MVDKYNPENNSEEELGEEENSKTKASIFQVNAEISWKCPPPPPPQIIFSNMYLSFLSDYVNCRFLNSNLKNFWGFMQICMYFLAELLA